MLREFLALLFRFSRSLTNLVIAIKQKHEYNNQFLLEKLNNFNLSILNFFNLLAMENEILMFEIFFTKALVVLKKSTLARSTKLYFQCVKPQLFNFHPT